MPTAAYGTRGVPLIPAPLRARRGHEPVPSRLASLLSGVDGVTVAALDQDWADRIELGGRATRARLLDAVQHAFGGDLEALRPLTPFSGLPDDAAPPPQWGLSARPMNALAREGHDSVDAVRPLTVGNLMGIRNFGWKSCLEVMCVAEGLGRDAVPVASAKTPTAAASTGTRNVPATESPWDAVVAALGEIVGWGHSERGARFLGELLDLRARDDVPQGVRVALESLSTHPLDRLVGRPAARYDLAGQYDRAADQLSTRERDILHRRLVADPPDTLDDIGRDLGLTRERVRQLQVRALRRFHEHAQSGPLQRLVDELRRHLGTTFTDGPSSAVVIDPRVGRLGGADPVLARAVVLDVAGYRRRGGWWVSDDTPDIPTLRGQMLDLADDTGVIDDDLLTAWLQGLGVAAPWRVPLLHELGSTRRFAGGWVRWDGTIIDKVHRVLALHGEPLTPEELLALSGEDRSARTVRNAVFVDDRFVRIDRAGRLALPDWGFEAYGGIVDGLRDRIEQAGGAVVLAEVVEEMVSQYGVSPNSVKLYAAVPMFVQEDGVVRLRRPDEPYVSDADPHGQMGIFLAEHTLAVARTVNHDILRGSGVPLGLEVAGALGVRPGESRTYLCPDGATITLSASTRAFTASMSALRQLAEDRDAVAGDHLVARLSRTANAAVLTRLTPDDDLGVWMKAIFDVEDRTSEEVVALLATALDCDAEPSAVEDRLDARGDDALLAALRTALPA